MKIKHKEDYRVLRAKEYPSVEEQMDALWHAMNDHHTPRLEPFYSMIKEVKDKFPKKVSQ